MSTSSPSRIGWWSRQTVGRKLALQSSLALLLMALAAGAVWVGVEKATKLVTRLNTQALPVREQVSGIERIQAKLRLSMRSYGLSRSDKDWASAKESIVELKEAIAHLRDTALTIPGAALGGPATEAIAQVEEYHTTMEATNALNTTLKDQDKAAAEGLAAILAAPTPSGDEGSSFVFRGALLEAAMALAQDRQGNKVLDPAALDARIGKSLGADLLAAASDEQRQAFAHWRTTLVATNEALGGLAKIQKTRVGVSEHLLKTMDELISGTQRLVDEDTASISRSLALLTRTVLGATAVAIALGAITATLTARAMVRQVRSNVHALELVAAGDLTAETPVTSGDELGRLAEALNRTVGSLRDYRSESATVSGALTRSAETLSNTSQDLVRQAEQTSDRAGSAASAAEEISANVRSVAAAVEQLSASIHEISRTSEQAARVAAEASQRGRAADEAVHRLEASSREIGEVVKSITGIAEQTNLLALNATIEAASAGDAGKGFAVVAGEVKTLARQAAEAADDIRKKIATAQEEAGATAAALSGIGESVQRIDELQQSIAAAVHEQSAATGEISRSVAEAAKGTGGIASDVAQVAAVSQETNAGAARINQASVELAELAQRLQRQVDRLRV